MKKNFFRLVCSIGLLCTGCATLDNTKSSTFDRIQSRGQLKCGVSGKIPGFSFLQSNGTYEGLDVEICRAISSAFLGDPDKVIYRPLTATERFTALRTGEIDILSRNTTINLSRDSMGGNGVTFAPVIFHDGQGLMVNTKSRIKKIEDLSNSSICVGSGTTTEQNLNDTFQERKIKYTPIKYQDLNQVVAGYLQGRCKAMTSDRSQLAAARSGFKNPRDHIILDYVLSKEPLAPASLGGDQKFSDAIRWIIYTLFAAEELNITKENISEKLEEAKNDVNKMSLRRFFGIDGNLGDKIGLSKDFTVRIIKSTGNYGEIYDKHLGPKSSVPISRGLNNSYRNNGLLISPPFK